MSDIHIYSTEFFEEIRNAGAYYVDKTSVIEHLVAHRERPMCFVRPRRFGKSLMLTMLQSFFDITRDSRALFDGLAISRNTALCDRWMNRCPVIRLTLTCWGRTCEEVLQDLRYKLVRHIGRYHEVLTSPGVAAEDKAALGEVADWRNGCSVDIVADGLRLLTRAMDAQYGHPVVVLIDEYDVPLSEVQEAERPAASQLMQRFYGGFLRDNPHIAMAVLCGCVPLTGEPFFHESGIVCHDIEDTVCDDAIGFTEAEVDKLAADAGRPDVREEMRHWFAGWRFGSQEPIYSPWDVLHYVGDLKWESREPRDRRPRLWWVESGPSSFRMANLRRWPEVQQDIRRLLDGETVAIRIRPQVRYAEMDSSPLDFWTMIYYAGYVKRAGTEPGDGNDVRRVVLTNRAVRDVFENEVRNWE